VYFGDLFLSTAPMQFLKNRELQGLEHFRIFNMASRESLLDTSDRS